MDEDLHLTFAQGRERAWLFANDVVVNETQTDDGFAIEVRWSGAQKGQFEGL